MGKLNYDELPILPCLEDNLGADKGNIRRVRQMYL